ncbi:ImmA/IrrE family metallo-endopeptidase [Mesorhizobium sp.]|uniref:ImmA/IrrE family metallo-endopeptidase n=1 Tax=Mesorhizobium sp. TaxID=1871066 RepID=UPI000FEA3CF5|nr:ImmA/IrrE family metallo-endopeptidase [Mesorhizobium sp.]RWC52559.1 MAG: ImmA/IrrE family metallo-endopeptidase [Mesorhizobium sp.]RWC52729.1 MAG: ImmA/IrrE family metallo-endopeptidase [Mesorhizobium sp.]
MERLQSISHGSSPNLGELLALGKYLRIPVDAIGEFDDGTGLADMRLRSSSHPDMFYSAEMRVRLITDFILKEAGSDQRNIQIEMKATTESLRSIDDTSLVVRSLFHLDQEIGPIKSISTAISDSGLAHVIKLRGLGVDGACVSIEGLNFIFVSAQYVPRMRFTVAHELAHVIFGHCRNRPIIDEDIFEYESDMADDEKLSNTFASCLLMPALGVARFISRFKELFDQKSDSISSIEIAYIARFFGSSFEAAGNRLEQIQVIDRGVTAGILAEVRRNFESAEAYMRSLPVKENYDEIPVLSSGLKRFVKSKIEDGQYSVSRVANIFGYTVNEVYEFIR